MSEDRNFIDPDAEEAKSEPAESVVQQPEEPDRTAVPAGTISVPTHPQPEVLPPVGYEYAQPPAQQPTYESRPPLPIRKPRTSVNVVLFLLTFVSSVYWGFFQYQSFYSDELRGIGTANPLQAPEALLGGLPFAIAAITFLLSHEMGHYLACRYYGISATLPYFIPMPVFIAPLLPGTMGAVIRITAPIKSRRALFDIAIAGPIAGWLVALPILAFGLSQSRVVSTVEIEMSDRLARRLFLSLPRIEV